MIPNILPGFGRIIFSENFPKFSENFQKKFEKLWKSIEFFILLSLELRVIALSLIFREDIGNYSTQPGTIIGPRMSEPPRIFLGATPLVKILGGSDILGPIIVPGFRAIISNILPQNER